jgi:hypothetical protein
MIDPKLFMQIDISEPLRLSPKAFINRHDENYFIIGLFDKDNARRFLKHLITAVYAFCDWQTPENLIPVWPKDTVNDLLQVIISLKKEKVLLTEQDHEAVEAEFAPDELPDEKVFLKDQTWIKAHLEAFKTVSKGAFVLNQGAKGGGYLARELAKNNECHIVSSSSELPAILYARKKAKEEKLTNIDFVFSKPANLSPICYADKFNVFITELFGADLFEQRLFESVLYAKKNLLSSDCKYIPEIINLKAFAYESLIHRDMVQESREFEILYGFKFNAFTEALKKHIMGIYTRLEPENTIKLSDDVTVMAFDLKNLSNQYFNKEFEITLTREGKVTGICTYFELQLTENIKVTNSPFDPQTQYMQRVFTPAASIYKEAGETIDLIATYDNVFRILIK